jgi:hypothetical protein
MSKRPRDTNQLAKMIVDISTNEMDDSISDKMKQPLSSKQLSGIKGGNSRANALTETQRSKIASIAASVRWKKTKS